MSYLRLVMPLADFFTKQSLILLIIPVVPLLRKNPVVPPFTPQYPPFSDTNWHTQVEPFPTAPFDLGWSQSKWRQLPHVSMRQLLSPACTTLLFPSFFFFVFNIKFLFFSTINSFYKYHTLYFHFSLTNFIFFFHQKCPSFLWTEMESDISKFNPLICSLVLSKGCKISKFWNS